MAKPTQWQFHSRQIKKLDKERAKCEAMRKRYEASQRQDLADKWTRKRDKAVKKMLFHRAQMLKAWNEASAPKF